MKQLLKMSESTTNPSLGKILVVDDEPELKAILCEALCRQGFEVKGFSSGADALLVLGDEDFDLLLTDLMMPEMDGITLLQSALEIDSNIVPVMMTGQGTIQTAVDAMKVGAFDYVLKPFRIQTLLPVLTRAMNIRHLRLENVQLREAVAIHELSQTIAFTLDPQTVLSKLADTAVQQSAADEVSVLLPTPEGSELYVAAVRGEMRERLLGERIPFGQSISSWVGRKLTPVILNGEVKDERFVALWPREDIRSSISVPMQVDNQLVGVLNVNVVNRARPFTLGQMKGLSILASTAAAALKTASLYAQVRSAEQNYRSIFENAVEGIFQSTPEGRFLTVNPSMARILGYSSPEELIEAIQDVAQQLYVDPHRRVEAGRIQKEQGVLQGFEFQAYRKDGEKIWLSLNRRSLRNENGEEVYREGSVEDITERKRAEEALRESEERYRMLFDSSPQPMWVYDSETLSFLAVNEAAVRHYGYSKEEFLAMSIKDIRPEEDVPALVELVTRVSGGFSDSGNWRHRKKDGTAIDVEITSHPIMFDDRRAELVLASDITKRKRAEAELRFRKSLLEAQTEASIDGILVVSNERKILAYNKRLLDLWRIPPAVAAYGSDEAALKAVVEQLADPDEFMARVEYLYDHPEERSEEEVTLKDGRMFERHSAPVVGPQNENYGRVWFFHDITERKRAEAERTRLADEIEKQRQRLDNIVATVPGVVWEAWGEPDAANQRIDFVSNYVEQMLGYTVEEWLSTPNFWLTIVHPDDREDIRRRAAEGFAAGKPTTMEFRWVAKDGRAVWVESSSVVIMDEQGRPAGLRGVNTDISQRKAAGDALRQSENQLSEAQRLAHIGSWNWDLTDNVTTWSDEHYRIFGLQPGEIDVTLDDVVFEFIHPDDRELVRSTAARALATKESFDFYYRVVRRDGEERTIQSTGSFETDALGKPIRLFGTAQDVTERTRIEQELRQSEERYRDLVENAHDIIYEHDLKGNYTSTNQAGVQITGYSNEETLKLNLTQTVAPEYLDKAQDMFRRKMAGEKVTAYELEIVAKDGRRIPVEVNTRLVYDNGRPVGLQGIARDVSERKELEEQLRQSQKMEAVGQLAGGVAHDFNNLLTAINGYSALALRRLGDEHPIASYLEEIKKAGDRAANLTRQLLAFGRKQLLQPVSLNLNDSVTDISKMLKRLIGEDINFKTKLTSGLKRIKADPGQIEQVLMNLVVNARDAMPKGGTITIETANAELDGAYASKHVGVAPGKYVMLAVSDTGTGIDQETQARIFEPFFTTKEKGKGTGLGLSTVYGIIRQSGGNVWVYSELGKGTTFKVYLPRNEADRDDSITKPEVDVKRGSETVLLVEDEDMVRNLASQILEETGYRVLSANGGEEAIQLFKRHKERIDLMITDVVMPKMSGKDVAERLKQTHPETKVLFMSGYTDEAIVHHGIVDSHIAFIQKPFSEVALTQKIREVLDADNVSRV